LRPWCSSAMGVLYILGAGCSWNYDQCSSPIPELRPPLNSDFFKVAKKIADRYQLEAKFGGPIIGFGHLLRDINSLYGYGRSEEDTTVFNDSRLTLEGVMNHFYLKRQILDEGGPLNVTPDSRTNALNELLAYTLAETLNGPPCRKHAKLASIMKPGDVVWNFNYDLLMDNALYALNKLSDSGYVIRFDYTLTSAGWQETRDTNSDVTVLKLHGSLNWLQCGHCGRNLLLREQKSASAFSSTILGGGLDCPKCDSSSWPNIRRLIVPPAGLKSFLDIDMRYLWRTASSKCKDVERIVVIGCRFSDMDYELDMMLRTMVQDRVLEADLPITIVNPDPDVVRRKFASIFGPDNISHETDFVTFLETPS
jgi:hypothetical protein